MTRGETPTGHSDDTGDDRIRAQRSSWCKRLSWRTTSLTGAPHPSPAPTRRARSLTSSRNR